jgi:uncharacterized protein YggE
MGTITVGSAQPNGPAGTVTVTGTGGAEAAPDLTLVTLGVETRAASVDAAYSAAGAALASVTEALRAGGVAAADVRSTGLNVRADYVWREGEGQQVAGYVASSSLGVRLRDAAAVSGLIGEAVRAGGNAVRLNSLHLTLADDSAVRERARAAAWEDALQAARQFAALASAGLGRVLSVTEHAPGQVPVPLAGFQRASAAESIALEPGTSRVETAVTVMWELASLAPA